MPYARYGTKTLTLVSTTEEHGRKLTPEAEHPLPKSTSKQYAGTLSTGHHYLVCTPTADADAEGKRSPLTIAVSKPRDWLFSSACVIRTSVYDNTLGVSATNADFSCPFAAKHDGQLHIGYTHKCHFANEFAVILVNGLEINPWNE